MQTQTVNKNPDSTKMETFREKSGKAKLKMSQAYIFLLTRDAHVNCRQYGVFTCIIRAFNAVIPRPVPCMYHKSNTLK